MLMVCGLRVRVAVTKNGGEFSVLTDHHAAGLSFCYCSSQPVRAILPIM